jgi:hypothetical protein
MKVSLKEGSFYPISFTTYVDEKDEKKPTADKVE